MKPRGMPLHTSAREEIYSETLMSGLALRGSLGLQALLAVKTPCRRRVRDDEADFAT